MTAGRPKKPNALHLFEGTARNDRDTDKLLTINEPMSVEPRLRDLSTIDREEVFTLFKDWVIMATGSAKIDEIMLNMMVDQIEIYSQAKKEFDIKTMGFCVDRFHKLAREFGMTPSTRDQMINSAQKKEEKKMKKIMEGPED